jgi:hypothetical protein
MRFCFTLAATAFLSCAPALALDTTLAPGGYTGLGITPNAHLLGWGRLEFGYDRQLPGYSRNPSGHNYVLGFGMFPNVEVVGRLAASSPQNASCFEAPGCGIRDLSASVKAGIGLDAAGRFRVAAGASDIGGAATNFRTYYAVGSFNEGPFELSAGLARRSAPANRAARSPLDGPFAAAAWQPLPWVRGHVEYADRESWAGVRLFAPAAWLPQGWTAHLGANRRLTDTNLTERSWWSAGLSIPLYKVPDLRGSGPRAALPVLAGNQQPLPAFEARTLPVPGAAALPPTAPAATPAAVTDAALDELALALKTRGLEDIWAGRLPDGSIAVRANNASYNWNSLDALGAALGAVSQVLGGQPAAYRLVLTQRQIPLVAVTGQADCLRQWIQGETATCTAGELSTPGTTAIDRLHAQANWVVRNAVPSWQTLRVALTPVLRTSVGTEVGVLDYSAGLNVGLALPLWAGASVEARHDFPLAESSDFEDVNVFAGRRVRSRLERLAFTQTVRVPLERWLAPGDDAAAARWGLAGVTAQGSIGRFGGYYDGIHGTLRWEPGDGAHRVTAQAGLFRNDDFGALGAAGPRTAKPALASYRYHFRPTRTYVEATAGNFMNNDAGFQLGLRQWFTDFALNVYYRRTQFQDTPARQFVGIQLSLPLGPRRDMDPAWHLQVTGTPRFAHGIESVVRETFNPVSSGYGVLPPVAPLETTFNSDRAGLLYFEDNIRRIRDAAR